ncbi:MAG: DUF790 family protein [Silvanigrellaceae bacterium]|nr:DUF790 family protein [Silvanigrellaceae bacterium]
MLTKNLLRYKKSKGTLRPLFIPDQDPTLLLFAQEAIDFLNTSCCGLTLSEIEAHLNSLVQSTPDVEELVLKGLVKLLIDKIEFCEIKNNELLQIRHKVFSFVSALTKENLTTFDGYQNHISDVFCAQIPDLKRDGLSSMLYSDLPEFKTALLFKLTTAENLLSRYNSALVQGLLLSAQTIQLLLPRAANHTSKLRELFKYLKFFQLIPNIAVEENCLRLSIDGPLNLFFESTKYGIHLANFFPAVLNLSNWDLQATCILKQGESLRLQLSQSSAPLKPYYNHFVADTPEELKLFQTAFQEKNTHFELIEDSDFLHFGGESFCFPDFYIINKQNEKKYAIEFFHPYHSHALIKRLEQLEKARGDFPLLVLGVSKKILKNPELKNNIESSCYFQKWGFLFKEMPLPEQVFKIIHQKD